MGFPTVIEVALNNPMLTRNHPSFEIPAIFVVFLIEEKPI